MHDVALFHWVVKYQDCRLGTTKKSLMVGHQTSFLVRGWGLGTRLLLCDNTMILLDTFTLALHGTISQLCKHKAGFVTDDDKASHDKSHSNTTVMDSGHYIDSCC